MHVSCNMFLLISSVCSDKLAQSSDTVDFFLFHWGVKKTTRLSYKVNIIFPLFWNYLGMGGIHKSLSLNEIQANRKH